MSLVSALKGKGPSGFGYGSTAEEVTAGLDLSGKTYLLTGANSGLGFEALRVLTLRGAHVLAAARTVEKARAALTELGAEGTPIACELCEPASVRAAVEALRAQERALDGILCNAGIMALAEREVRYDLELQFLTNHVGHFILVTGLLETLADRGRVVMLSSSAHRMAPEVGIELDNLDAAQGYKPWRQYGQSKLANLLFARSLAERLASTGKTANACHPGVIRTNLGRHMSPAARAAMAVAGPVALKTIPQGAATECYLLTHPDVAEVTGEYFADCNVAPTTPQGADMVLAERLWETTEALVAQLP